MTLSRLNFGANREITIEQQPPEDGETPDSEAKEQQEQKERRRLAAEARQKREQERKRLAAEAKAKREKERERRKNEAYEQAVEAERSKLKEAIREQIEATLKKPDSDETQVELSRLLRPLESVRFLRVAQRRELLELVNLSLKALAAKPPRLKFAQANRSNIERFLEFESFSLVSWVLRKCGDSPLLAALFGSFISFFLFVCVIGTVVYWTLVPAPTDDALSYFTRFLVWLGLMSPSAPVPIPPTPIENLIRGEPRLLSFLLFSLLLTAGQIGAFISITTRLHEFATLEGPRLLLVFLNAVFKPVISMALSLVVVALLIAEILVVPVLKLAMPPVLDGLFKQAAVFFVIGFFCGYSERWAKDIIGGAGDAMGSTSARRDQA
jgi:hypothetical protein